MDLNKTDEMYRLLETFSEVGTRLKRLNTILETDRDNPSKRNICGFLVSPELYYSIYEQIKSEYLTFYNELKNKIE